MAGLGEWGLLSQGAAMVNEALPPCAWQREGGATLAHTWDAPAPGALHGCVPSFLQATSSVPHCPFLSGPRKRLEFLRSLILWLVGASFQAPVQDPGVCLPFMDHRDSEGEDCVSVAVILHPSPRSQTVHTTYWINDGTHSCMQWQLPQEEGGICFVLWLSLCLCGYAGAGGTTGMLVVGFNWFLCVMQGISSRAMFTLGK